MPELTANMKVGLGILAATAALITGLLGNVLAANISAFFSGTAPKTGKRPAILWAAFAVFAALSVVAGSLATFAPVAAANAPAPQPKIVVTNLSGHVLQADAKSLFMICRDTVQMANTSDVTTSVVTVGTSVNADGSVISFDPTANRIGQANAQMRVVMIGWRAAPAIKNYANVKTLDGFNAVPGLALPVRVEARNTAAVFIDFAIKFAKLMPQSVTAMHVLRFPDIADVQTDWVKCK